MNHSRSVHWWNLLWLGLAGLFLYNFFADVPQIERMAQEAACAGRTGTCAPVLRRFERTPFGRNWDFDVGPSASVHVACQRAYILVGDYACRRAP